jgi:hypothetical protein
MEGSFTAAPRVTERASMGRWTAALVRSAPCGSSLNVYVGYELMLQRENVEHRRSQA